MELQGLMAQSTMEAEIVAIALTTKEAILLQHDEELGSDTRFDSVPLYLDNTLALYVTGNRTYSRRIKHVALRYFFVQ